MGQIRVGSVEIEYKLLAYDTSEIEERHLAQCVSDVSEPYIVNYGPAYRRQCLNLDHPDISYTMIK